MPGKRVNKKPSELQCATTAKLGPSPRSFVRCRNSMTCSSAVASKSDVTVKLPIDNWPLSLVARQSATNTVSSLLNASPQGSMRAGTVTSEAPRRPPGKTRYPHLPLVRFHSTHTYLRLKEAVQLGHPESSATVKGVIPLHNMNPFGSRGMTSNGRGEARFVAVLGKCACAKGEFLVPAGHPSPIEDSPKDSPKMNRLRWYNSHAGSSKLGTERLRKAATVANVTKFKFIDNLGAVGRVADDLTPLVRIVQMFNDEYNPHPVPFKGIAQLVTYDIQPLVW
ncbi:hypothetical protein EV401DRAFT_1885158 [Pisolithus croceorrhizus]|nr:hypothetical protein EV401DRAFT_1885158 [Pisolithus croceorrhizus]